MTSGNISIIEAIDKSHIDSHRALRQKDINLYLSGLSDSIQYTQLNGKTINKLQLQKDTEAYFERIHSVEHTYTRDSYSIENNTFTENITQDTSIYIKAFIIFLVKWNVKRKGIYSWQIEDGKWKMVVVKILDEKTKLEKGIWFFTKKTTKPA